MQRHIQRAILNPKNIIRRLTNPGRNTVPMTGTPAQRLQYQQVECALQQFEFFVCVHVTPRKISGEDGWSACRRQGSLGHNHHLGDEVPCRRSDDEIRLLASWELGNWGIRRSEERRVGKEWGSGMS